MLREIRELGYQGSSNLLVRYINPGRVEGDRAHVSPCGTTRLLLSMAVGLTASPHETLAGITAAWTEMTALAGLISSFAALLTPDLGKAGLLTQWITAARAAACPTSTPSPAASTWTSRPQRRHSGPVHATVGYLLDRLPEGLRLMLATRSDPPLRLGRRRALGELTELRAADLRFTEQETAELLRRAAGAAAPGLTGTAIEALTIKTEGWVAGLQLAGLSLPAQDDIEAFVAAFSGSHRYVLDYLTEEVLDRQPDQVRDFLLETSVLDRLSGELCDAVTGRGGGQAMLERIERAGLFLMPLDEVRGWWRYHHLFADLLQTRLRSEMPGQVTALHPAAAAWHAERGLPMTQ